MLTFDFGPFSYYRDRSITLAFFALPFGRKLGFFNRRSRVWSPLFNGFVRPPLRKRAGLTYWNTRKEA